MHSSWQYTISDDAKCGLSHHNCRKYLTNHKLICFIANTNATQLACESNFILKNIFSRFSKQDFNHLSSSEK